jgi:carbamoyltransferase
LLGKARQPVTPDGQSGSLLGPRFTNEAIEQVLRSRGVVFENTADEDHLLRRVAQLLADGHVVGWFQGRMEFGPRALGGRSILGDPRNPRMQSVMNLKIKFRESFRPFAPAVLREEAANWFALPPDQESPYMLVVADVLPQRRVQPGNSEHHALSESDDLCERVNAVRSQVPAVTHVDYSARLQTVDSARNPRFYRLLRAFQDRTGCPMLVNTSFNVRGEPLVCSPEDAIQCFLATGMDVLVLEDCVVLKSENLSLCSGVDRQRHMQQFSLD